MLRRPADPDRGTSLLEVVIACVLLGVLSAAVLTVVLQTQSVGVGNRNRVAAANLAAREIDMVRAEFGRTSASPLQIANAGTVSNQRPLDGGSVGQPLVVDGVPYTVTTSAQWNITGNGASACDGGSLVVYPTLGITVSVTWPNMGAVQPVSNSTQLAPPKGSGIPDTDSFVAVRVSDQNGDPSVGRRVAVSGGGTTRTGATDAQGCAVVQVSPAAVNGTEYTAQVVDSGYVDISSTERPSKIVGVLTQGQLNNDAIFQVARAGTVNIRMFDESGAPMSAPGAQLTLVSSQASGASNSQVVPATGSVTPVRNLWPTEYGAYFGVTPPEGGFDMRPLAAGGSLDLDVTFQSARIVLSGMPAGTTAVYASSADAVTTCVDNPDVAQVDPARVSLLPGTWSFFASGPGFECSPGPARVALDAGDNGEAIWGETTVRVSSAPAGTLWALNRGLASAPPTSCPVGADAATALNIDGARTGDLGLPAGDWFIYVTDAAGGCAGVPAGQYPKTLEYDVPNAMVWPTARSTVTVQGAPSGSTLYAVAPGVALSCQAPATGAQVVQFASGGSLPPGTWQVIARTSRTTWTGTTYTCTNGGSVVVDGSGTRIVHTFRAQ